MSEDEVDDNYFFLDELDEDDNDYCPLCGNEIHEDFVSHSVIEVKEGEIPEPCRHEETVESEDGFLNICVDCGFPKSYNYYKDKLSYAISMFEKGKISSGRGAEIANMTLEEFRNELNNRGIPLS